MMNDAFEDHELGRVTWHADDGCWKFEAGPIDGRSIPAHYDPEDSRLPPAEQGWDGVRACVRWIREQEPAVRAYLTGKLYQRWIDSWYDDEIDELITAEQFREKFRLDSICFYQDQNARLLYDDDNLFGGHSFCLEVDASGRYVSGPDMFG
jgi:hypothetical protein